MNMWEIGPKIIGFDASGLFALGIFEKQGAQFMEDDLISRLCEKVIRERIENQIHDVDEQHGYCAGR